MNFAPQGQVRQMRMGGLVPSREHRMLRVESVAWAGRWVVFLSFVGVPEAKSQNKRGLATSY